jgi:hypothetical protein
MIQAMNNTVYRILAEGKGGKIVRPCTFSSSYPNIWCSSIVRSCRCLHSLHCEHGTECGMTCNFVLSFRIAVDFISKKKESLAQAAITDNETKSLLELYLSSEELDLKDVTGMAMDMLLTGVDTVRL